MKREEVPNERDQDSWLGGTLRQAPSASSGACPDSETLAAWVDGGLSARAASDVEVHASTCSHCMAVLAAMERSAPAVPTTHVWTPARLFRWVAPLAAAATALAIWVAVPDRPITPAPERYAAVEAPASPNLESRTPNFESGTRNTEPGTLNPPQRGQSAPSARIEKPASEQELQRLETPMRERAEPRALGAAADSAKAAPSAAPSSAPPPSAASEPTDRLAESVATTAQRSALASTIVAAPESASPSNPLVRWRIVTGSSIERSTDGGKTWAGTTSPATTLVAIRAVDADRAVATNSENTQFYTTNRGLSWTRVQEKSAAPF